MTTSPDSWFQPQPMLPTPSEVRHAAHEVLLSRAQRTLMIQVCRRVVGTDVEIGVGELPLGAVELWARQPSSGQALPTERSWVLHHQMAREIRMLGWHTEVDARRLLVLGWSLDCLKHRIRLLQVALERLSDFEPTAHQVAIYAGGLLAGVDAASLRGDAERDFMIERAGALLAQALRWPQRLAELGAADRSSQLEHIQLTLAQVLGLEAKVERACEEHLLVARMISRAVYTRVARGEPVEIAQRRTLAEATPWLRTCTLDGIAEALAKLGAPEAAKLTVVRPPLGLTERRLSVSSPNHPAAYPDAQTLSWERA